MLRFLTSVAVLFTLVIPGYAQNQTTNGDCSPNVNDVGGNVTINCQPPSLGDETIDFSSILRILSIPSKSQHTTVSWHELAIGLRPLELLKAEGVEGREAKAVVRVNGVPPVDPFTNNEVSARIKVDGANAGVFSVSVSWQSLTYRDAETITESINSIFERGGYNRSVTCGIAINETYSFTELTSPVFKSLYATTSLTHRPEASHVSVTLAFFDDLYDTYQSFAGYRDMEC